ncbi:MAG: hypothetical protein EPN73_03215 [Paraburkholderia sp.]|uniref:DUF6680 family protein n=1 Tax=Paraburkholderia sp. TaxID=1926495 RepID=UPI00121CC82A|nr:DUF6680 family protein [Paraburkholderia sp.]TAL98226.1 MAG: hypothetical protein EPN73_03215 [Paraburkholderia sp.]
MGFDFSVRLTDLAIVFATFFGPVFAVRAQRKVDDLKAKRGLQERAFHILMANRATWLAPVRVEALNSIPIAFYGDKGPLKKINEAWRELLHHFDTASSEEWKDRVKEWESRRLELDIALLRLVGEHLGFEFPALDVKTQHYFPVSLGDRVSDEEAIRRGMARVLSGKMPLPVAPIVPDSVFADQNVIREAVKKVLAGEQAVSVKVDSAGVDAKSTDGAR